MSKFTLEDFEYLSRITAKVEQHSTLTRIAHANGIPAQKQDNKQENTRSEFISDLISFGTPVDTAWTSYKPLLPFSSHNDVEGVYPTAPRMPVGRRQFRQPVFQEVRRVEIPLSDDEDEEQQDVKEHVIEKKYVPPHQRERPFDAPSLEGQVQHSRTPNDILDGSLKKSRGFAISRLDQSSTDPQRGWRDFQPSRPKPSSAIKPILPEKATESSDIPIVVCDKCGSTLNLETLRQLLLVQAPEAAPTPLFVPTLMPALPTPLATAASEPTAINGERDLHVDQVGLETQPIVQEVPRNDILPPLKITTDFELMKVDPSAKNEQFAAAAAMWRTRSTSTSPISPKVVNNHPVITKVSSESLGWTPIAAAKGRSDPMPTTLRTTAVWKPLNDTTPTIELASCPENLDLQTTTDLYRIPVSDTFDKPTQVPSNGKIPSDLLFGWGPDGNGVQTQASAVPRVMPASSSLGIGWDDNNDTPPRPVSNGWDPEFAIKVPSPGYAVSSQRRSPVFVSMRAHVTRVAAMLTVFNFRCVHAYYLD